jgi:large subunit ribosomal protein L15
LEIFEAGTKIDRTALVKAGLVSKKYNSVKLLGDGEISKSLTVAVDKVSESARVKINAVGGTVEV